MLSSMYATRVSNEILDNGKEHSAMVGRPRNLGKMAEMLVGWGCLYCFYLLGTMDTLRFQELTVGSEQCVDSKVTLICYLFDSGQCQRVQGNNNGYSSRHRAGDLSLCIISTVFELRHVEIVH